MLSWRGSKDRKYRTERLSIGYSASPWLGVLNILPLGYSKIERWTWLSYKNSAHGIIHRLQDRMNASYPPTEYSHLPPHPSLDHRRLVMSTWHVIEQVIFLFLIFHSPLIVPCSHLPQASERSLAHTGPKATVTVICSSPC